jgi:phosphoribosylglycinamide formyltransferase-1
MKFSVFISGNGSNLQAIIDACKKGYIKSELALVVCNNTKAFGLKRAATAGIKTTIFESKNYTNKQSVDRDMLICLKKEGIDFIVLAGYMRILTPHFVKEYHRKILNVHPSLLPSFKGVEGIKDSFTYGAKVTGVTIHFVDEKMDHGPIILQQPLSISDRDTLETLEARIHKIEHHLYPKAISMFEQGRLTIKGRRVILLDKPQPCQPNLTAAAD